MYLRLLFKKAFLLVKDMTLNRSLKFIKIFFYKIRYILCKLAIQKLQGMYGENMFTSKMSNNGHGV